MRILSQSGSESNLLLGLTPVAVLVVQFRKGAPQLSLSPQRVELTLPLFEPGRFALLHGGIGVPVDDLPVTIFPAINLRDA